MTYTLKPLSADQIPAALEKAAHYRLLNEPRQAESICLDILNVEHDHQEARIQLLLSLSDQFGPSMSVATKQAEEIAASLKDRWSRVYYTGIVKERLGWAALQSGRHGSDYDAFEWLTEAMSLYDEAEKINPANQDSKLRWNTCARIIMQHHLTQRPPDRFLDTE